MMDTMAKVDRLFDEDLAPVLPHKKLHDLQTTSSDDEETQESASKRLSPSPYAPPKKARVLEFDFDDRDALSRLAVKIIEVKKRGRVVTEDHITPASRPSLLRKMSHRLLSTDRLEMSTTLRALIRECEIIASEGRPREDSNVKDLRRLLYFFDDFAMVNRRKDDGKCSFDREHQIAQFIARMKIINALHQGLALEAASTKDSYCIELEWKQSRTISDRDLATWMYDHRVCHSHMIIKENDYILGHRIHNSSLECFWQTVMAFMHEWPMLPMSGYVVRLFDELRIRAAFFMSYRELMSIPTNRGDDDSSASEGAMTVAQYFERADTKIMGLGIDMFGLYDMNTSAGTMEKQARMNKDDIEFDDEEGSWLDSRVFTKISGSFGHINADFIDECEVVFHHMQVIMRSCVGFVWPDEAAQKKCIGCASIPNITDEQVTIMEDLVAEQMEGSFRTFVRDKFRAEVFDFYVMPSEIASFSLYNPHDVATAQNCISRKRNADFRIASTKYLVPEVSEVWDSLKGEYSEPAYQLLAAIGIGYYMQETLRGARLEPYYIDASKLEPILHQQERVGGKHPVMGKLHTPLTTTGTLYYRNKLVHEEGLRSSPAHMYYQHPLILRRMNSICIHYNGHLHRCKSFSHAFLSWVYIMCEDPYISGEMSNNTMLYPLYSRLFPDRAGVAEELQDAAHAKMRKWNPITKIVDRAEIADEREVDRATGESTARDHEIHKDMTQF